MGMNQYVNTGVEKNKYLEKISKWIKDVNSLLKIDEIKAE